MTSILPELARLSAERMLNGMAEGLVMAFVAWVLLRAMGRRNASTRFAVWFAALLVIAALPWVSSLTSNQASGQGGEVHSAITVPGSWAMSLFLVWAVIASLALVRVAVGLRQLRKLRAASSAVDLAKLDPVSRKTVEEFQATRPVTLAVSDELRVPTAMGFFNPLVVLPAWALCELSAEELNSILIHELAHLRRRDDWTNLAQKLLRALLFFHPAVWWVEKQLSLEREMACDDVVLSQTASPRTYAGCLISVAEKSLLGRGLVLAQAAVSKMRQTSIRVGRILDGNRPGAIRVWRPAVGLVAVFSVVAVVGWSRVPQLVAFQDSVPNISMVSVAAPVGVSDAAMNSSQVSHATSVKRVKTVASQAKPVLARSVRPRAAELRALEARMVHELEDQGTLPMVASQPGMDAQTIMVVMQTRQWDGAGSAFWIISVWHLTVLKANQVPTVLTVPAKSI